MKKHSSPSLRNPHSGKRSSAFMAMLMSLTLSACETPLFTKTGGEHLKAGDEIILAHGDIDQARAAYQQALESTYPEIQAQAAYNLAIIAKEQGRNPQPYLEQAAAAGNMQAKLELVDFYKRQNPPRYAEVERLSLSLSDTSAAANINLLERAHQKHNERDAALYAAKAEKILLEQISVDDTEGKKSLVLARLYKDYGDYFDSPRNPETYYRKAMLKGNVKAAQELAEFWNQPGPHQHSPEDVFAVMVQAADAGNEAAIKYVGSAYEEGLGVARDINKAMSWNEKPQARMKTDTLMRLAHASVKSNPEKAIPLFSKAAAQGSTEAAVMLYGLKASAPKSLQAYAGQNPDSLFSVVKKLEKTYGKTNPALIERQYTLAAEAGSGKAAIRMAKRNGQNIEEQNKWYEKAAELGNGPAMIALARRYKIGGQGQSPDTAKAFIWFEKAANAGEPEGMYETGVSYGRGEGVKQDKAKAKQWLEKAQEAGYVMATEMLKNIDDKNSGEPKP